MGKISILGFAGSLRKDSYNKSILRAAIEFLPNDTGLEIFDLEGFPPFNQDLEEQPPEKVKEFKIKIRAAVVIIGASIGMGGTMRAQYHLRQCFVFLNMHPINQPEVMVPLAHEKIDQSGRVIDKKTKEKIKELINNLITWTRKLK